MVKRNPFERELSRFYKLKNHEKEKNNGFNQNFFFKFHYNRVRRLIQTQGEPEVYFSNAFFFPVIQFLDVHLKYRVRNIHFLDYEFLEKDFSLFLKGIGLNYSGLKNLNNTEKDSSEPLSEVWKRLPLRTQRIFSPSIQETGYSNALQLKSSWFCRQYYRCVTYLLYLFFSCFGFRYSKLVNILVSR